MKPLFLTYSVIKKGVIKNIFFILLVKKIFFGLVKMTFGLVDVGYSLPEGQAVKLIFFAPWIGSEMEVVGSEHIGNLNVANSTGNKIGMLPVTTVGS